MRELEASHVERTQALALLQRSGAAFIQGSSEWQATEMLRAGHAPTEPYIARVLNSLRGRSLGKLLEGRLLCPGSLYIVGQPGQCLGSESSLFVHIPVSGFVTLYITKRQTLSAF